MHFENGTTIRVLVGLNRNSLITTLLSVLNGHAILNQHMDIMEQNKRSICELSLEEEKSVTH